MLRNTKRTILLTGKTGQIGSELLRFLPDLGNVAAPARHELDLLDANTIRRAVRATRPELIINAAAYTGVDAAETHEADACAINASAPAVLAEEAKKIGAAVVHYSTDYVFDGSKRTPYEETDSTSPINVYGKTKLAGDEAIGASGVSHLIFRTGWVYATRGRNFLLTILRLAAEREELRIVNDQVGSPTCASDLAAATIKILTSISTRNRNGFAFSDVGGTYHMTAAGQTTWYEFAKAILEKAGASSHAPHWLDAATQGRRLLARRVIPIPTEEFQCLARRPAYSVLSNSKLIQTFGARLPDWRTQLHRCFVSDRIAAARTAV